MHDEHDPTGARDDAVPAQARDEGSVISERACVVPKVLGRDAELSTTGIDPEGRAIDPYDVATAILDQVEPTLLAHDVRTWRPYEDRNARSPGSDAPWSCPARGRPLRTSLRRLRARPTNSPVSHGSWDKELSAVAVRRNH